MSTPDAFIWALPPRFRRRDILAFHQCDLHATAEWVGEARLEKGRLWRGLARLAVWTLRRVRFVARHANKLGLSAAHRMQPRRRQAKSGD